MSRLAVWIFLGLAAVPAAAQIQRMGLVLPTDNRGLLDGKPEEFYQFIDRSWEGQRFEVWEGGQFGFVRDPRKLQDGQILFSRFHEGLDIRPAHRSETGEPLDEVRSIAAGEVVHTAASPGQSNYGRYVVVRHDWGYGPFFSLYAHLREIRCEAGGKVGPGSVLGILGYSGTGLDRRRAHTHVELNLLLSSRFVDWHDSHFKSPNHHGIYNGLNLVGLDLAGLFLAHQKNPALTAAQFITQGDPYYRVAVPGSAEMELLKNYPWLCLDALPEQQPPSWEIAFTGWGLPVSVRPGSEAVSQPVLVWCRESAVPHYYPTRGCVTGSNGKTTLTTEGLMTAKLVCGDFSAADKKTNGKTADESVAVKP